MTRTVRLPDGTDVPALGQGTWHMGENGRLAKQEVAALKLGIELGVTLIDTAEMYGSGGAEQLVGEAIAGKRDGLFIVSKVLPSNASRAGTIAACERSLKRMRIDCIDLYLLHWPGSHPLAETVEAFGTLRDAGKIRYWGVSNFDTAEMERLAKLPTGGACATNQVLYHPDSAASSSTCCRGARRIACRSWRIRRWVRADGCCGLRRWPRWRSGMGRRRRRSRLRGACGVDRRSRFRRRPHPEHVRENAVAGDIVLTEQDLAEIDARHAPPRRKQGLEIL